MPLRILRGGELKRKRDIQAEPPTELIFRQSLFKFGSARDPTEDGANRGFRNG
jgi:hypothetical protein